MNRENKRKTFEKGYYKTHACHDTFICKVCGRTVVPENAGSDHRNHCPNCLSSLHVDIEPGDRESSCGGIMEPIAVWVRRGQEPTGGSFTLYGVRNTDARIGRCRRRMGAVVETPSIYLDMTAEENIRQ